MRRQGLMGRSAFWAALFLGCAVPALWSAPLCAYPEFQRYSQEVSGRYVNCGMCHQNSEGPEGIKHGQIGGLSGAEFERLSLARAALQPGTPVDSPILNEFGNHIIEALGKVRVMELRERPEQLADALGAGSDLDWDGIPDAREFLDGTHPLNPHHGNPWRLFAVNLRNNLFHLAMIFLATVMGLWGLGNLSAWLHAVLSKPGAREDAHAGVEDEGRE